MVVVLILPVLALALSAQQNRTLVVTVHAGEMVVVEMSGHSYVEVEAKDFIKAGIEEMSMIREWRITLRNAVQRGYPIAKD